MKTFVIGDIHGRCAQLHSLLDMLPRDESTDTLIFLGDLIDRGSDVPGCVEHVFERVICLGGNYEQMLLVFVDGKSLIWLDADTGGARTFEQYTQTPLPPLAGADADLVTPRQLIIERMPASQIEFFRSLPLYHEDEFALYVHAGLEQGKHPRDSSPQALLWTRDMDFYKGYRGKPCVFGHTPTTFLPILGRIGHHGIYIFHSAIGIDTGYNIHSPLSCLSLPDFMLYQTYADGQSATHHITF